MTTAIDRLAEALTVWPLDREQKSFIQRGLREISEDRARELVNLLSEAESLLNKTASGVVTPTKRKVRTEHPVRQLLVQQLGEVYSAEKQALRCMQKALRMASAPALREGIELHIEQTQTQIERVEQAMETLQSRPGRKVCEAMRGLVEEAQHSIGEQDDKGPILDLVIVAGMQRIEHYEIAAYGTDIALAEALGEQEVVDLLTATLEEEKQTDLKLTEVTQQAIMPAAMEEGTEEEESSARKKLARVRAA